VGEHELPVGLSRLGKDPAEPSDRVVVLVRDGLMEDVPERNDPGHDQLDHLDIVFHLLRLVDQVADDIDGVVKQFNVAKRVKGESEQGGPGDQGSVQFSGLEPASKRLKDQSL